jgi:hypothetical protein
VPDVLIFIHYLLPPQIRMFGTFPEVIADIINTLFHRIFPFVTLDLMQSLIDVFSDCSLLVQKIGSEIDLLLSLFFDYFLQTHELNELLFSLIAVAV